MLRQHTGSKECKGHSGKREAGTEAFLEKVMFKLGLEGPVKYVNWREEVYVLEKRPEI